jgi:hypothetical protein
MPIIALAGYAIMGWGAAMRPEPFEGRALSALSWLRLAGVIFCAGMFSVLVADARGANLNMNYVLFPLLALTTIAVANLKVQLSRNKSARTAPPGGGIRI